jgi:hypothetical protein
MRTLSTAAAKGRARALGTTPVKLSTDAGAEGLFLLQTPAGGMHVRQAAHLAGDDPMRPSHSALQTCLRWQAVVAGCCHTLVQMAMHGA